jgi:hypothetical protein
MIVPTVIFTINLEDGIQGILVKDPITNYVLNVAALHNGF